MVYNCIAGRQVIITFVRIFFIVSGGTDVQVFEDVGQKTNIHIPGSLFSLTNKTTNTPVYYISVQCRSGAGQMSTVKSSRLLIQIINSNK